MFHPWLKGSLWASFFLLSTNVLAIQLDTLVAKVEQQHSDSSPLWHAILQLNNGQPTPHAAGLLTTQENFSALNELKATLAVIFNQPAKACRYPARKRFLESELSLPPGSLTFTTCADYETYKKKVPVDRLHLVYASENVTQASSMLGHIMLRMDGVNDQGLAVKHGVTFYTELDSVNVPKILWQSLFSGRQGFFQVGPYAPFAFHYSHVEERNIWEYELNFPPLSRLLIRDMVWEFGKADLPYFFHTHNCATVTQRLLSIGNLSALNTLNDWLTPLDVVKFVTSEKLVSAVRVIPADKWQLRSFKNTLPAADLDKLVAEIETGHLQLANVGSEHKQILHLEFARIYNNYAYTTEVIEQDIHLANQRAITSKQQDLPNYQLDISGYKNPTKMSAEAEFAVGLVNLDSEDWLQVSYAPVARGLDDDNRQIFAETSLRLSPVTFRYSAASNTLKLDEWLIYGMNSRIPFDRLTGGFSSGLTFGIQRQFDQHLNRRAAAMIEVRVGITTEVTRDLGGFAEFTLGAGADTTQGYLYSQPRVGLYMYTIGNMKTRLEAALTSNQHQSHYDRKSLMLSQTLFMSDTVNVNLNLQRHWTNLNAEKIYRILLRYKF